MANNDPCKRVDTRLWTREWKALSRVARRRGLTIKSSARAAILYWLAAQEGETVCLNCGGPMRCRPFSNGPEICSSGCPNVRAWPPVREPNAIEKIDRAREARAKEDR
jgi:hypothetical protein